jgi:hypothetical protein
MIILKKLQILSEKNLRKGAFFYLKLNKNK